ncbi:MAG: hypothetical protein M0Z25_09285 [Nitrospiraceae bacterium]|nr:hypothetical protein [Nitrospiraceae bacterium]
MDSGTKTLVSRLSGKGAGVALYEDRSGPWGDGPGEREDGRTVFEAAFRWVWEKK